MIDCRRPFGAVAGNLVVDPRHRIFSHRRSHGKNSGIVSRDSNRDKAVRRRITSTVACSHYDHNACLPRSFHCLVDWIEGVAFEHRASERHIDHPDVVGALQRDRLFNGSDYLAVGAGTVLVQHAQVDEINVRSHTGVVRLVAVGVAGIKA